LTGDGGEVCGKVGAPMTPKKPEQMTKRELVDYCHALEDLCKSEHERANQSATFRSEEDERVSRLFPCYRDFVMDFVSFWEDSEGDPYDDWDVPERSLIELLSYKYRGLSSAVKVMGRYLQEYSKIGDVHD